ncbi:hypothetical protein VTI74DRAFT_10315 [Chaetomium olivicolor]
MRFQTSWLKKEDGLIIPRGGSSPLIIDLPSPTAKGHLMRELSQLPHALSPIRTSASPYGWSPNLALFGDAATAYRGGADHETAARQLPFCARGSPCFGCADWRWLIWARCRYSCVAVQCVTRLCLAWLMVFREGRGRNRVGMRCGPSIFEV